MVVRAALVSLRLKLKGAILPGKAERFLPDWNGALPYRASFDIHD